LVTQRPRRRILSLAAGAAALPAVSRISWAQAYPTKPVRITVGYAAGGFTDITARLMGQWLSERLGQAFIIENRPGAAGNIATESVVRAAPDGYTLLVAVNSDASNATLYDKLNFNFVRDIAPVAGIVRAPSVMVVNPSFPATTVPEFIAYAKAHLGKVNMGSAGVGSNNHLSGELFKIMAGVNMIHVPYRGEAPALADMFDGQVQVIFSTIPGTIEYIRSGRLRALAVTTPNAFGGAAGHPDRRRFRAGLRVSCVGWCRRTQADACRDHRQAKYGNQCSPRRSEGEGAPC
jgi:tripartite-type tricarboxylate transporter receptor subunit TctC